MEEKHDHDAGSQSAPRWGKEELQERAIMRDYRLRKKLKEQRKDPVKVQLLTLKELPQPFTKWEFAEICR